MILSKKICYNKLDSKDLINPHPKLNPDAKIEFKETEHLFFKLSDIDVVRSFSNKPDVFEVNIALSDKCGSTFEYNPVLITGDLNQDETVNVEDLIILIEIVLTAMDIPDYVMRVGDLNYDASIDLIDILILADMLAD